MKWGTISSKTGKTTLSHEGRGSENVRGKKTERWRRWRKLFLSWKQAAPTNLGGPLGKGTGRCGQVTNRSRSLHAEKKKADFTRVVRLNSLRWKRSSGEAISIFGGGCGLKRGGELEGSRITKNTVPRGATDEETKKACPLRGVSRLEKKDWEKGADNGME